MAECKNALGMENGSISDGQISASSEWNTTHHADQCRVATTYYADQWDATHYAHQGRLQFKADGVSGGTWSAAKNDIKQWLKVDLGSNFTRVAGLATQGRGDYDWWVIEYKLLYSSYQNSNFRNYKEREQKVAKVNIPILYMFLVLGPWINCVKIQILEAVFKCILVYFCYFSLKFKLNV